MNLPLHSIDHQQRLNKLIADQPDRITGSTIIVEENNREPNQLYFGVQAAYKQLIFSLRENDYIGKEPAAIDDFAFVAFPRAIVQLQLLETIDLIVSVKDGSLVVELLFNYKGAALLRYETSVHTSMPYLPVRALEGPLTGN